MNMKTKLNNLLSELNHGFIGREEMVKSALLTMIAGENLLLIGPPGTGKSLIARQISQALAQPETPNQAYFEYLLTKFSTPEELFGPLSISELKQDRFHRNTQGYLPTVQVAFLDEIFKASSSILNALLTILNERKFHNGTQTQNIPLQALIAASNELPKGQAELSALYDRFLVRRFVDYVGENQLQDFFRLPEKRAISPENQLSRNELAEIQQNAAKVAFTEPIQAALLAIWAKHKETFKENADERLSDRRFAKILHLLRISAFTNQREQVDLSDLFLLKDCLWNDETNAEKVRELIMDVLRQYDQHIQTDENTSTITPKQIIQDHKPKSSSNKFKGLMGMGTSDNPILIQNINDLQRLENPDISAAGLYFKQTANIDGTILGSHWLNIKQFTGHYNGGGYTITTPNTTLFQHMETATIKNMRLLGETSLANSANKCTIQYCYAENLFILERITASTISHLHAKHSLAYSADKCTIQYCYAENTLILEDITTSTISHCWIEVKRVRTDDLKHVGISLSITSSSISQCFVCFNLTNTHRISVHFFADTLNENSSISDCVAGNCSFAKPKKVNFSAYDRLINYDDYSNTLQNNIVLQKDDVAVSKDVAVSTYADLLIPSLANINSTQGKDIPPTLFTQSYLENNLNWDFEKVWEWDKQNNQPVLRPQLFNAMENPATQHRQPEMGMQSLLVIQCNNNIWL